MADMEIIALDTSVSQLRAPRTTDRGVLVGQILSGGITQVRYLTGSTLSLASNVPTATAVGDLFQVSAYSSTSATYQAIWKCASIAASLPSGAIAGNVTGNALGDLYVLNSGSSYYKFQLVGQKNVDAFGAVGNGSTNDYLAVMAAINSLSDGGTVYFSAADYIVNSPIVISPAAGRDFVSNVHFVGLGGHHTDLGTRVQLNGGDATNAGLSVKSGVQMSFEDINFIGASSALALITTQAAGASPYYSSFNIKFDSCRFACATPVKAIVWINNSSNVEFNQCTFQGAQIALQVGSNTADSINTGTISAGTADQVSLFQCFLAGDIVMHRLRGLSFNSCIFDERNSGSGEGVVIYAAGDQLVRGVNLQNNWAAFGNNTRSFFTMGTSGFDLVALNNFISTYEKGFVLDGVGSAVIEGNEFKLDSSGAIGVDITATTFYGDSIQNNNWAGMHATSYRIKDARSAPVSPVAIAPIEVNANLGTDYTITNAGTGFEDVLTQTVKMTGGMYRLQASATITTGATASVFNLRINTDSQNPYVGGKVYIPANQSASLTLSRDVILEGTTGTTTARLQIYQVTGGTAATVEATDTTQTTMMQITRMSG